MEKYLKEIAREMKRIRIELEKQNSMVESLNTRPYEENIEMEQNTPDVMSNFEIN